MMSRSTSGGMWQLKLMDDLRSPPAPDVTGAEDGSNEVRMAMDTDGLRDGGTGAASLKNELRPSVTVARWGMPMTDALRPVAGVLTKCWSFDASWVGNRPPNDPIAPYFSCTKQSVQGGGEWEVSMRWMRVVVGGWGRHATPRRARLSSVPGTARARTVAAAPPCSPRAG
jgi:hypothetical protein